MNEQTPITAEGYLKEINWWDSGSEPDGKFWADQWQLAECMEQYANAKVLEALERLYESTQRTDFWVKYEGLEDWIEKELKQK